MHARLRTHRARSTRIALTSATLLAAFSLTSSAEADDLTADGSTVLESAIQPALSTTAELDPTEPANPVAQGRFRLIYLTGTHSEQDRTTAIMDTAHVVEGWYAGQLHGRTPNIAGRVTVVRDTALAKKAAKSRESGQSMAESLLRSGLIKANEIPVIFVEGFSTGTACGWAEGGGDSPRAVIIPMDACRIYPSSHTQWPYGATYLTAHEVGHALGLDHTYGSNQDLLYDGGGSRNWAHLRLSKADKARVLNSPALARR